MHVCSVHFSTGTFLLWNCSLKSNFGKSSQTAHRSVFQLFSFENRIVCFLFSPQASVPILDLFSLSLSLPSATSPLCLLLSTSQQQSHITLTPFPLLTPVLYRNGSLHPSQNSPIIFRSSLMQCIQVDSQTDQC